MTHSEMPTWLESSLNPKLKLTLRETKALSEQGVLHRSPHEVSNNLRWRLHEMLDDLTFVNEPEREHSPEFQAIIAAIRYILEHGDKRLLDTLSESERDLISRIAGEVPKSEFSNPFNLPAFIAPDETKKTSRRTFEMFESLDSVPAGSLEEWEEHMKAEAERCRCKVLYELDVNKYPGNSHKAIPAKLQEILIGLSRDRIHGVPGLAWCYVDLRQEPLLYAHLTPKGRAVYTLLDSHETPRFREMTLTKPVSEVFSLPPGDSYEFLSWELYERFLFDIEHASWDHEVWQFESLLRPLGLLPIHPADEFSYSFARKYRNRYRPALISQGVDSDRLFALEEKFSGVISSDFESKRDILGNNILFVVARVICEERPDLAKSLILKCRILLKACRDSVEDTLLFEQSCNQLKSTLRDDPIMYILFYDMVYDAAIVIEDYEKTAPKRGRKKLPKKLAADAVLCELVDLLRKSKVRYPYDRAARVINLLANEILYELHRKDLTDTTTRGGSVLRSDYCRLRQRDVT